MKKVQYLIFLSILLFTSWFCTSSTSVKNKDMVSSTQTKALESDFKNVAVLELFTSQGCSSCPPADRLMGSYASKENVIVLSFHVDYWNRLGWKDHFSSKEYTQRQYNYASAMKAGVYTPQLVVNGQKEMVGSDENKIAAAVKKILTQEPDAALSIKTLQAENGKINISFAASGNTGNSVLNIALVEKKTVTEIKAGENGGVTLTNYNVVRNFKTISKVNEGNNVSEIDISPPSDLKNMSVVLFLQEKGSNKIIAAVQAGF